MVLVRYGLWDFTEIWVIPANQVGACQKSWVITGYGLSERWVMTESTVIIDNYSTIVILVQDTLLSRQDVILAKIS